jgi:hypothetical protein
MPKRRNPSREDITVGLLDELYGQKDSHREMARQLMIKYNNAQSSVTSVLKYLIYYRDENML